MTPQVYMQLTPASDTKRVSHRPTMSDTASAGVRFQDSYLGRCCLSRYESGVRVFPLEGDE
jgi:hypothetical protein